MKKFLASILTLTLCLGLATGCAGKQTPAENNTESAGETGVKEIPSLKIAFSPYADADQITTATEPLEQLLQAKLLEKGYDVQNIDMTVGTSYTAVGEALSAGSADIGFISGGNYVLFSDDCDVLLTALRYAINKDSENPADWNDGTIEENTQDMTTYYRSIILAGPSAKGQELLKKVNAGEELTWDDLNSATWSVLAPTSASGYIYPSLWLQEHYGKTIADLDHVVQSDSHSTSLARLATGQADVMVSYGHIRIKNAPIWQEKLGGTVYLMTQEDGQLVLRLLEGGTYRLLQELSLGPAAEDSASYDLTIRDGFAVVLWEDQLTVLSRTEEGYHLDYTCPTQTAYVTGYTVSFTDPELEKQDDEDAMPYTVAPNFAMAYQDGKLAVAAYIGNSSMVCVLLLEVYGPEGLLYATARVPSVERQFAADNVRPMWVREDKKAPFPEADISTPIPELTWEK